jgi:hypothetical protein
MITPGYASGDLVDLCFDVCFRPHRFAHARDENTEHVLGDKQEATNRIHILMQTIAPFVRHIGEEVHRAHHQDKPERRGNRHREMFFRHVADQCAAGTSSIT